MFLAHFGVAMAAKRAAPAVSVGTLFLAAQFADLLWPNLVLLGIEIVRIEPGATAVTPLDFVFYPYSHSLVALTGWSALAGALYLSLRGASRAAGVVVGLTVLSHWGLDVLSHRPDVPLTIGGSGHLGLGLWNSLPATLLAEAGFFGLGLWLYTRETRPLDRIGSIGFGALALFLAVVALANAFGPPPPDAATVAWSAQAMWLLVLWGYWVDGHRHLQPRSTRMRL
jgi:hypothetical protein